VSPFTKKLLTLLATTVVDQKVVWKYPLTLYLSLDSKERTASKKYLFVLNLLELLRDKSIFLAYPQKFIGFKNLDHLPIEFDKINE